MRSYIVRAHGKHLEYTSNYHEIKRSVLGLGLRLGLNQLDLDLDLDLECLDLDLDLDSAWGT